MNFCALIYKVFLSTSPKDSPAFRGSGFPAPNTPDSAHAELINPTLINPTFGSGVFGNREYLGF